MVYDQNELITSTTIYYRIRLHLFLFVKPSMITLAILGIGALIFYAADLASALSTQAILITWAVLLIIAAIPVLAATVNRHSAEFAVTNKRVILKIGFIQSKTAEMFLNKIESVGIDQRLTGRVLVFGTIVIRGTGGSLEPFHQVSAPLEFRKQIQEQIGKTFEPIPRPAPASSSNN